MAKAAKPPEQEWSVPVLVDDIPSSGKTFSLSPNETEKKAIAKRLGLLSLDSLKAKLNIVRENGHIFHVEGSFDADVTQSCVVTLEPLKASLSDMFEAWYADHEQVVSFKKAQHEAMTKKEMIDLPILEENEDPEQIEDGKVDLGELVIQYLSLSVDPYPHKEGINYENKEVTRKPLAKDTLRPNPFAALKNWRPKD